MALSMTTPNLMGFTATLSITTGDFECPNAECCCPEYCYAECHYAECCFVECHYALCYIFTVVLSEMSLCRVLWHRTNPIWVALPKIAKIAFL
jgi:hypothetical protein